MDVNQELISKNGLACIKMARIVIGIPLGGRLPTVSELSVENDIPIGTTHNALKTLIKTGAVEVVSRGHMGSYLVIPMLRSCCILLVFNICLGLCLCLILSVLRAWLLV